MRNNLHRSAMALRCHSSYHIFKNSSHHSFRNTSFHFLKQFLSLFSKRYHQFFRISSHTFFRQFSVSEKVVFSRQFSFLMRKVSVCWHQFCSGKIWVDSRVLSTRCNEINESIKIMRFCGPWCNHDMFISFMVHLMFCSKAA